LKLPIGLVVTLALVAGPAAAQGTFNNGKKPGTFGTPTPAPAPYKPYVPSYGAAPAAKPRSPGMAEAPDAPTFKPYQPYKPASTYGAPKPPSYGAKPCETSVYVNSCDR
jgi:hypothetical protein